MIHWDDRGPQSWNSVHVTHRTTVAELIDVDNVGPQRALLGGFDMFRHAGESLDEVIRAAHETEERILSIGSGWALSDINITDGWLVNTKLLNGCYDIGDRHFDAAYPAADRPGVVLAQAGMQIAELNAYLELIPQNVAKKRALKAAGIGNGQTIAGAISGNTHGSQINFGAMPDFVVGLHIATGSGPDTVDREGIEARTQSGLCRDDWRRPNPRRRHLQRGRGQLRHVRDHRGSGTGNGAHLPARVSGGRRYLSRRPEGKAHGLR